MEDKDALLDEFRQADTETNQANKALVLAYQHALEGAGLEPTPVIDAYTSGDYAWRGVYPFEEQQGAEAVAETFWKPLLGSWAHAQRRQDILIAGTSVFGGD